MAGTPFSQELFNTREELVSSDLMQAQNLASRDAQDVLASATRSLDSATAVPGTTDLLRTNGAPISALDLAPTFTPSAGLTATLGAGSGYSLYASGVPSNQSTYQVLRWPSQTITFGTGGGSPRIDTVYAQPVQAVSVTASRNVLVDPVARTVTAQTVNKQGDPLSTIGVIAGAAAANPVPNASGLAAITGAVPLFYVYVPAGVSATSGFGVCRGIWRRAPYPFSTMSGVVSGMGFIWDLTVNTVTPSFLFAGGFHRICIDGELMEFVSNFDSRFGSTFPDTSNNPFGSAAGSKGQVYFIYAAGGRRNPLPSFNTADGLFSPVTIVESLTPPNIATGKPTANLTANGVTITPNGAVYVGLGFVYPSTTNRAPCIVDGDMTYFGNSGASTVSVTSTAGVFSVILPTATIPTFSTRADIVLSCTNSMPAGTTLTVIPDNGTGAASAPTFGAQLNAQALLTSSGAANTYASGTVSGKPGVLASLWAFSGHNADPLVFGVRGVNHRVKMLGLTAGSI